MSDFKKKLQEHMERVAGILGLDSVFDLDDEMRHLQDAEKIDEFIKSRTENLEGENKEVAERFLQYRISDVRREGKGKSGKEGE